MLQETFNDSSKISKFTRICMELIFAKGLLIEGTPTPSTMPEEVNR